MAIKLMYITNRPDVALVAEKNGVDRIFLDMEFIGKAERQGGMDSVQNHHTLADVKAVRKVLTKAELLVRINPLHEALPDYMGSETEIDEAIKAGADIIMLPYYKTTDEVKRFLKAVNGRCKTMLLLETPEAVECLNDTIKLPGIDEIHIGLNDLAILYGKKFMFELLTDGTVERLCRKLAMEKVFFGFGGIASLGRGLVPAEMIIKEHYRLGSRMAILSRSFCNVNKFEDIDAIEEVFFRGVREIRGLEKECAEHYHFFSDNQRELVDAVQRVVDDMESKR